MIATLREAARDCWTSLAPGRPAPRRIHCMKLGWLPYPAPESALVVLLFADGDDSPFAVAKTARVAAGDALVRAEIAALATMQRRLSGPLARHCPLGVASGTCNERTWLLMTALPGQVEMHHMWRIPPHPDTFPRLQAALDFAAELRRQHAPGPMRTQEFLARSSPTQVVRDIAATWHTHEQAALLDVLEKNWERAWPAGPAHGDFFPGNVLFDETGVSGVVDWSFGSEQQPYFVDVLQYELSFLLHATLVRHLPELAVRRQLQQAEPFAHAQARLAADGVEQCGPGGAARSIFMVAGALRRTGIWAARAQTADVYAELLRTELGVPVPGPHAASARA